jgi:hypothetical protein
MLKIIEHFAATVMPALRDWPFSVIGRGLGGLMPVEERS